MGIFGWDYPPGVSSTPYDDAQAVDLSTETAALVGQPCRVYWTEDCVLYGCLEADLACPDNMGDPYGCIEPPKLCDVEWNDELSDDDNYKAAAAVAAQHIMKGLGNEATPTPTTCT